MQQASFRIADKESTIVLSFLIEKVQKFSWDGKNTVSI